MAQGVVECLAVEGLAGASLVRNCGGGESVARHAHRTLVVSGVTGGFRRVSALGRTETAGPGSVLVITPGMVHSCEAAVVHAMTLCLPATVVPDAMAAGIAVHDDPALHALVLTTWEALAQPDSASKRDRVQALLDALVARPPRGWIAARAVDAPANLSRVKRELDKAVTGDGTGADESGLTGLDELSGLAGMSPWGLNKAFSRTYGLPPHSYGLQKKIERAKELLASGMPLAQVAAEAGFTDQSHFSHKFKRLVGMTPGRYARAFQPEPGADA